MNRLRAWLLRFTGIFTGKSREHEMAEELESHLHMHIADNLRSGMSPEEARRMAMVALGGVENTKQAYRDRSTIPWIESLMQDLRFARRQLYQHPGFAVIAILVLALGIGACVAIFAFVDAALLKPLPYWQPHRLDSVTESVAMIPRANLSYPDYLDWKSRNDVYSSLDVWNQRGYMLQTHEGVKLVHGARVSDGFFRTLGVKPMLGRDFYSGEDLPSAPNTVALSYSGWQKWFGGRVDIIGQPVTLSGDVYTVVAVLPAGFHFAPGGGAEFWTTLHVKGDCDLRRSCHSLNGVGRLKDGVSTEKAAAEMKTIAAQLEQQYPDSNRGQGAMIEPLREIIVGDVRPILMLLLAGAGLLLLIACVNVSSLLLVRSESRRREIAVRGALGASRSRLLGLFLTEGLVLVSIGAGMGVLFAALAIKVLVSLISTDLMAYMPFLVGLGISPRSLAFAAVLSVLALLLFTLAPAVRFLSAHPLTDGLSDGGRTAASNTWRRFASKLVVIELATALVLLAGAGLLGRSLFRLLHVDVGFQPERLATVQVALPASYAKDEQQVAVTRQIVSQLSALPGVTSVGVTTRVPVSSNGNTTWIRIVGHPYDGEHNEVNDREVSAQFFQTLQARLIRGRFFTDAEDASKPNVVVINQALAKKYFPGEDPIGKQIGDNTLSPKSLAEVIGIVGDVKEGSLEDETWPAVYYPFNQGPDDFFTIFARTGQSEESLLPTIISNMHQINPGIAAFDEMTMAGRIQNSPSAYIHRTSAWIVGSFAGLALLLGVVGLYGVVAYSVSQRTREIGVRMALGAQRSSVYQLILREAGWLTLLGVLGGLVCAVAAGALLRKMLFGIHSWDIPTLTGVAVLLTISALLASYIPARRAASVNPVDALRTE